MARVCLFDETRHNILPEYRVDDAGLELEKSRLQKAVCVVTDRLDALIEDVANRVGTSEAAIFRAHKTILRDSTILRRMFEGMETGKLNAETAVANTFGWYESRLSELDDDFLRERSTDIAEIRHRLLDALGDLSPSLQCEDEIHCRWGRDRIIVAKELTPGLTMALDAERTIGFVTERGGPTSHAAILARSLGIPAVSGIENVHAMLSCGTDLLLNGHSGEVIVWPSDETIAHFRSSHAASVREPEPVDPVPGLTVMANISRAADVCDAINMRAEGIGLYRTEFEFLAAGGILSEEDQFVRYASVVQAMAGRPVYFRMLDIGGDKNAPFFNLPQEENPSLGLRGSRLLLVRNDLFSTQARALARASTYGPVHVMYPMIVELEQFVRLRELFEKAVEGLSVGRVHHGVLFEVPSACLQADELLEVAEFASVGSNDLIQYLFAVDRNNEFVTHDYTPDKPAFWSLLGQIAHAAAKRGRPLSLCGEMAGNPRFLPKLMELGLTTISVSPRLIPDLRLAGEACSVAGS